MKNALVGKVMVTVFSGLVAVFLFFDGIGKGSDWNETNAGPVPAEWWKLLVSAALTSFVIGMIVLLNTKDDSHE